MMGVSLPPLPETPLVKPVAKSALNKLEQIGALTVQTVANNLQRHDTFTANVLPFAILIQSSTRIMIANKSAADARFTQNEQVRKQEAITTTAREVIGFILNYAMLRVLQTGMTDMMRGMFGVKIRHYDGMPPLSLKEVATLRPLRYAVKGLVDYGHNAVKILNNEKVDLRLKPYDGHSSFTLHPEKSLLIKNPDTWTYKKLLKIGEKVAGTSADEQAKLLAGVQKVYKELPPIIASIPAILLAGFWLEHTSLKHGKQFVTYLSKHVQYGDSRKYLPVSGPQINPSLRLQNSENYSLSTVQPNEAFTSIPINMDSSLKLAHHEKVNATPPPSTLTSSSTTNAPSP